MGRYVRNKCIKPPKSHDLNFRRTTKLNNIYMNNLGLTEAFLQESKQYKNLFIGRVSSQSKNLYKVITEHGEIATEISGKFHYSVKELSEYPAVGDFVMVDRTDNGQGNGIIHHVLAWKSVFARKVAGSKEDIQIVATNIDTVFYMYVTK